MSVVVYNSYHFWAFFVPSSKKSKNGNAICYFFI